MRRVVLGFVAICLLTVTSCRKTDYYGGSWTFESSTYSALGCTGGPGPILNASNTNNNNVLTYSSIECDFYGILPDTPGRFYVVAYPPKGYHQMSIALTTNGGNSSYASTGGNGMDTVHITVNSSGYVTVTGSGIEMLNTAAGSSDSSTLSLDLIQTQ